MKHIVIILTAIMLSGCGTVILPAWYAPIQDHTLQCEGGSEGECAGAKWGSEGGL